jgi:hypothetical protein
LAGRLLAGVRHDRGHQSGPGLGREMTDPRRDSPSTAVCRRYLASMNAGAGQKGGSHFWRAIRRGLLSLASAGHWLPGLALVLGTWGRWEVLRKHALSSVNLHECGSVLRVWAEGAFPRRQYFNSRNSSGVSNSPSESAASLSNVDLLHRIMVEQKTRPPATPAYALRGIDRYQLWR